MIDTWTLVCLLTIVGFAGGLLGLFVGHLHAGQQAAEREAKLRAELADAHGARPLVIDSLVDLQEELLAKSRDDSLVRPLPDLTHELRPRRHGL